MPIAWLVTVPTSPASPSRRLPSRRY